MCDTMVATGAATADGSVILAKNSDRDPNEPQPLAYVPHAVHPAGATVRYTYAELPQVRETYEVILSQPSWLWGGEMGANECGVAIGNEAVFTKEPYGKEPGLIGMDLIRLALERAGTARGALDVIVELLAAYGQGGNCGYRNKSYYHNSFLIADPREAWVLETAGRYWAAERVRDVRAISNGLTIGREWDLASPGLVEHAVERGWCRSGEDLDFSRCYGDPLYTRLDGCRPRQRRATELLAAAKGSITPATMMAALRDHGPRGADAGWNPSRGLLMDALCAHAFLGPLRAGQTTGSLVAHLRQGLPVYWLTGTAAPCTGVFRPVYPGGCGLPEMGPRPGATYDPDSLWWAHERLHRAVLRDYPTRLGLYGEERDALERAFLSEEAAVYERRREAGVEERRAALAAFSASCFERAGEAGALWAERVEAAPARGRMPWLWTRAWKRHDREAGMVADARKGE